MVGFLGGFAESWVKNPTLSLLGKLPLFIFFLSTLYYVIASSAKDITCENPQIRKTNNILYSSICHYLTG
jgi:hypothetical protein